MLPLSYHWIGSFKPQDNLKDDSSPLTRFSPCCLLLILGPPRSSRAIASRKELYMGCACPLLLRPPPSGGQWLAGATVSSGACSVSPIRWVGLILQANTVICTLLPAYSYQPLISANSLTFLVISHVLAVYQDVVCMSPNAAKTWSASI
jgi:hypothetical protein